MMYQGAQAAVYQKPGGSLQVDIGLDLKLCAFWRDDADEEWPEIREEHTGGGMHTE